MSVTLPSVTLEECSRSQSASTIQGDTESSGADAFWMGSKNQENIRATGFEVIFLWHKTISQTILIFERILKNDY